MLCHSDALTQPIIDPRPELSYRTVNGKLRFIWESFPEREHYKLVLRNHSQLCQIAHRVEDMFNIIRDDVVYNDWPVSWLTGLPFCYISTGCTIVKSTLTDCPAEKVVSKTWDLIEKEKCTIASLQPSMIQMLSSHCEDIPEPHWKLKVLSTTGFVRQSVMDAIGPCTDAIVTCCSLIEAGVVSRLMLTDTTKTRYTEGCVGDLTDPVRTRFDTKGPGSAKPTKVQAAQPYKRCQASFLFMAIIYSCFIGLIASEPKNTETTEIFEGDLDSPGNLSVSNTVEALKEMLFQERKENKKLIKAYQDSLRQIKHGIFKETKQLQEVDVPEKTEPTAPPQTKNGNKNTITISLVVLNGILFLCCAICVGAAVVDTYFYTRTVLQFGELLLPAQRQKLAKTVYSTIFTGVFCGVVLGVTLSLLLNL
ncbi:uncharacterized protein LOC131956448 [Physella acuta]|uniref:uncharacterized protein LOC131956448 n=1 Tax=Physella acuta TaxID=109671 RepID=UPI0027DAD2C5|nr:uncharacterized protein LOC131956448 [Physella acuta]